MNLHLPWSEDIVLGHIAYPLPFPQFRLNKKAQSYHGLIWGQTGRGKSRLLRSLFLQHLRKGHAIGLLEPHHDLSFEILCSLIKSGFFRSEQAYTKLVYIDWNNGSYVPFNVLIGGAPPADRALNVFSAMLRVWPSLEEAPLFKRLFLSCLIVLIANNLPITLLNKLLIDPTFRQTCLAKVSSNVGANLAELIQDTLKSYERLGKDQMQAANSTLNRIFALSFSDATALTLSQPENWLTFRKWMDEGVSFILNLGNIHDEETRKLVGALVMVQIEQAALSRKDLLPSQRKPFTLLVDEWPSFASQANTLGTILSQTRKFNLRLYLAAQSLTQVSSARLSGALENCRLQILFGLGRHSAKVEAEQIGDVDPFAIKEEPLTETQHSQYLSIPEQFESWTQELQNLSSRMAYVKLDTKPAARIRVVEAPDIQVDQRQLEQVLSKYKAMYQRTREETLHVIQKLPVSDIASLSSTNRRKEVETAPAYTKLFRG